MTSPMPTGLFDLAAELRVEHENLQVQILREETRQSFLARSSTQARSRLCELQKEEESLDTQIKLANDNLNVLKASYSQAVASIKTMESILVQKEAKYEEERKALFKLTEHLNEESRKSQERLDQSIKNIYSKLPGFDEFMNDWKELKSLQQKLKTMLNAQKDECGSKKDRQAKADKLTKLNLEFSSIQEKCRSLQERKENLLQIQSELENRLREKEHQEAVARLEAEKYDRQVQAEREQEEARLAQEHQRQMQLIKAQQQQPVCTGQDLIDQRESIEGHGQFRLEAEDQLNPVFRRQDPMPPAKGFSHHEHCQTEEYENTFRNVDSRGSGGRAHDDDGDNEDEGRGESIVDSSMNITVPPEAFEEHERMTLALKKSSVQSLPKRPTATSLLGKPSTTNIIQSFKQSSMVCSTPFSISRLLGNIGGRRPETGVNLQLPLPPPLPPIDLTPITKSSILSLGGSTIFTPATGRSLTGTPEKATPKGGAPWLTFRRSLTPSPSPLFKLPSQPSSINMASVSHQRRSLFDVNDNNQARFVEQHDVGSSENEESLVENATVGPGSQDVESEPEFHPPRDQVQVMASGDSSSTILPARPTGSTFSFNLEAPASKIRRIKDFPFSSHQTSDTATPLSSTASLASAFDLAKSNNDSADAFLKSNDGSNMFSFNADDDDDDCDPFSNSRDDDGNEGDFNFTSSNKEDFGSSGFGGFNF